MKPDGSKDNLIGSSQIYEVYLGKPNQVLDERVDAIRWFSQNPPQDEDELRIFAAAVAGQAWLETVVCEGHGAPWIFLRDGYFLVAPEILGVGPRSGFKTQTLGLLNALELLSRPGLEIVHAAASLRQAQRAQRWTVHYTFSDAVKRSGLVDGAKPLKWEISLGRIGSRIEVLPGTASGFSSAHAQRMRLDEFEEVKPDVVDHARLVPSSFGGHERGIMFVSTRRFRDGNVDRLLYDRRYAKVRKVIWCVAEVAQECTEARRGVKRATYEVPDTADPAAPPIVVEAFEKCGQCALLGDCRGQFARSRGWVSLDDLAEEFAKVDRATWNAQKRSRRIEEGMGRVFAFSERRHVREMEPVQGVPIQLAVDFGGGTAGKTAVLFFQWLDGEARVLAEYVQAGSGPEEDVPQVESILDRLFPGAEVGRCPADCAVPLFIDRWNELSTKFQLVPVRKLNLKREMIATLAGLIQPAVGRPKYYVHPRCEVHIRELLNFRYRERISKGIRQSAFADRDVDTVDAACYLAVEVGGRGTIEPRVFLIEPTTGRVETSEPPPVKFEDGKNLTYETYVGAKLWNLLRRNRS